jgi:hypothetical protein
MGKAMTAAVLAVVITGLCLFALFEEWRDGREFVFTRETPRKLFWLTAFYAFSSFESWQETLPHQIRFRTEWEGRLWLYLLKKYSEES